MLLPKAKNGGTTLSCLGYKRSAVQEIATQAIT